MRPCEKDTGEESNKKMTAKKDVHKKTEKWLIEGKRLIYFSTWRVV